MYKILLPGVFQCNARYGGKTWSIRHFICGRYYIKNLLKIKVAFERHSLRLKKERKSLIHWFYQLCVYYKVGMQYSQTYFNQSFNELLKQHSIFFFLTSRKSFWHTNISNYRRSEHRKYSICQEGMENW